MIGFYSSNHVNYFIGDIACAIHNFTSVPIYDTHGEEGTKYIFEQTKLEACFIHSSLVNKILEYKKKHEAFNNLKTLIILDDENIDHTYDRREDEIKIYTFGEFEQIGIENFSEWEKVTPHSIYSFSYTSGSTGMPKGALISNLNITSVMKSAEKFI